MNDLPELLDHYFSLGKTISQLETWQDMMANVRDVLNGKIVE